MDLMSDCADSGTCDGNGSGYARVSSSDQNLDLQLDALRQAGCGKVFKDQLSGARVDRPSLKQALDFVRKDDTLVVWRLDRLARSLPDLLAIMQTLEERGAGFSSLTETIDTNSAGGRLIFTIFGALAEFERQLIIERTRAGLAAARERGRVGGRPRAMTDEKRKAAEKLLQSGTPPKDVAELLGVSLQTLYRHLPARRTA